MTFSKIEYSKTVIAQNDISVAEIDKKMLKLILYIRTNPGTDIIAQNDSSIAEIH